MLLPVSAPGRRAHACAGTCLVLRHLTARQSGSSSGQPGTVVIIIIVGVVTLVVALIVFFVVRRDRRSSKQGSYHRTAGEEGHLAPGGSASNTRGQQGRPGDATTPTVDRTTSIRSIMTLPAYRTRPSDGERILGREGERDGVDIIVEHSTAAEEEALREEEMETLYQIRLTGRREREERAARREERARARAAGDSVALAEIRSRHAAEREASALPELRQVHGQIKERRQRAVSSVSYHDLGVARADGSRLRANSSESERIGLLSDAASIGGRSTAPQHARQRSASSVISFDAATDMPSPGIAPSGATTPRLRSGSSADVGEMDLGNTGMLGLAPPGYDEVQLSDVESRSPTPTYPEPPPDYPGNDHGGNQWRGADNNAATEGDSAASSRRSSRGVGGVPQLPSLRIGRLPEIVIEPSTAAPTSART
ncbi:uncharacterized protein B0I36DRAFT_38238 [Microdochium trichocladiopsis]|uniref:Uncharacterized protein n=1 Tax=Microdochium trichocladiopsis TaxID=1682393 RepID=A0A9P9BN09_9PEZI|nr:uncharacterized protein B0I36DRAFT_38238 [Microdochium trichocladiopsis]KAH7018347.1 hypothetical protein B0I36DRAFT_38238 [Microdochium trichocladiopsis]